jgi:NADH-quinone oxidoreductase subunit K
MIVLLNASFSLLLIAVFGILFQRQNILIILMCIELILLSANLNFIIFSLFLNDFVGHMITVLTLTVAASESAIGLALLIVYFKIKGSLFSSHITSLKN